MVGLGKEAMKHYIKTLGKLWKIVQKVKIIILDKNVSHHC